MYCVDFSQGVVFEKGVVYVVLLMELFNLLDDIQVVVNVKLFIGCLDLLICIIIDGGVEFDCIMFGYFGLFYVEICLWLFFVLVCLGMCLN